MGLVSKEQKYYNDTLACYGMARHGQEEVTTLLNSFHIGNNIELTTVKQYIRNDPNLKIDFLKASTMIYDNVMRLYPVKGTGISTGCGCQVAASEQSHGHYATLEEWSNEVNGIDTTDKNRYYSSKEWPQLPRALQTLIRF